MRISDMLTAIASWLESPDNEAILLAEYDDDCLELVANSCVQAAALLKITAEAVEEIEPPAESVITPSSVDELSQLATAFDESGDAQLQKQAAVIDELLLTIATPPDAVNSRKAALDKKIDELKKKYEQPTETLREANKINESMKAIDKSNMLKDYEILEAPLSTRYCPDHAGANLIRVGDHVWQCELDKKVYDFESGFTLNNGRKVPGSNVSNQTQIDNTYNTVFNDSRN
jgi:hypothetical protein